MNPASTGAPPANSQSTVVPTQQARRQIEKKEIITLVVSGIFSALLITGGIGLIVSGIYATPSLIIFGPMSLIGGIFLSAMTIIRIYNYRKDIASYKPSKAGE